MKVTAIVPAAGKGKRMGGVIGKPYLLLGGKPILSYTLKTLNLSPEIQEIILVTRPEEVDYCEKEVVRRYNLSKVAAVIPGGEERQDSVYQGLKYLKDIPDLILIHDAVRPFLTERLIREVIKAASSFKAAIAAIPVRDTIKEVDKEGLVKKTIPRDNIWDIQTPQAFEYSLLRQAYEEAFRHNFYATDDAALVERCGYKVKIVSGAPENIKITLPGDLPLAEAILELNRR